MSGYLTPSYGQGYFKPSIFYPAPPHLGSQLLPSVVPPINLPPPTSTSGAAFPSVVPAINLPSNSSSSGAPLPGLHQGFQQQHPQGVLQPSQQHPTLPQVSFIYIPLHLITLILLLAAFSSFIRQSSSC